MVSYLCKACATQFPPGDEPPRACPICEDERQYIPHDEGQAWVRLDELLSAHEADIRDDHGILGIGCTPSFGIGQRALLATSPAGNVLWDCAPYLDDAIVERIEAEGGLAAIAVSHPHYYATMVEWAHAFDCPIYVHADDEQWVQRPDPAVRAWEGETLELGGGLTLIRCGGHYAGGQVLHWAERRALLSGDIVHVIPDRNYVSFMYSYPNMIPLAPSQVQHIADALEPFPFETIHGAWFDRFVPAAGSNIVRRSVERYLRAVSDPGLSS